MVNRCTLNAFKQIIAHTELVVQTSLWMDRFLAIDVWTPIFLSIIGQKIIRLIVWVLIKLTIQIINMDFFNKCIVKVRVQLKVGRIITNSIKAIFLNYATQ